MNNRVIKILATTVLLWIMCVPAGRASGLEVSHYPFEHTYNYIHWNFQSMIFLFDDVNVAVAEDAVARLYHDDKIVAVAKLEVDNYSSGRQQATVVADFEKEIVLPKGEKYVLLINHDLISSLSNPQITNDVILYEFEVMADIGPCDPDFDQVVFNKPSIRIFWWIETEAVGESHGYIYRKDKMMLECPLDVTWDWNLGVSGMDFGKMIYFQKDVEYSFRIPAGSISSIYRSDITNNEVIVPFTGGYEIQSSFKCVSYKRVTDDPEIIGKIRFVYDTKTHLTPYPLVRLYENGKIIAEVEPTIENAASDLYGRSILTVDFGDFRMDADKGYSVMVPEATVASEKWDMVVNDEYVINLTDISGLGAATVQQPKVELTGRDLILDGMVAGTDVRVVAMDGRTVAGTIATAGNLSLTLPGAGIYILSVGDMVRKIVVR